MTVREKFKSCITEIGAMDGNTSFIFDELKEMFLDEQGWLEAIESRCKAQHYEFIEHNYNEALLHYELAVKAYEKFLNDDELNTTVDIARTYCDIERIHSSKLKDNIVTIKYYDLAIASCISSLTKLGNQRQRFAIFEMLAKIYQYKIQLSTDENERQDNVKSCIQHRELQLQELIMCYSPQHIKVAKCISSLADLQASIFLFQDALVNYEKVIEIQHSQDNPDFAWVANTYNTICQMMRVEQKKDYSAALYYKTKVYEYWMKADEHTSKITGRDEKYYEPKAARYHWELAEIYLEMCLFETALEHLTVARRGYEDSLFQFKEQEIALIEQQIEDLESLLLE